MTVPAIDLELTDLLASKLAHSRTRAEVAARIQSTRTALGGFMADECFGENLRLLQNGLDPDAVWSDLVRLGTASVDPSPPPVDLDPLTAGQLATRIACTTHMTRDEVVARLNSAAEALDLRFPAYLEAVANLEPSLRPAHLSPAAVAAFGDREWGPDDPPS